MTKHTAWKVWYLFDVISNMFSHLRQQPMLMQVQEAMPTFESFTVLFYHCTSNCLNMDKCRRVLFCQGRSIDNIPPKSAALLKHTLRSCYIVGPVHD